MLVCLLYLAAEQQVEKLVRASDLDVGVDGDRVVCLVERIQDLVRADGRASLEAVGEVLALEHLLESRLAKQSQQVGALHLAEPFGVASNLELVAIEDEMDLVEIRARRSVDLVAREDRPCFRPSTWVADHRREVTDDQNHRVAVVLKRAQDVEDDKVSDVQVGRGRVEAKLHTQ